MRGNALRRHHVLGDSLPHGAHRLDFVIAEVNLFPRHRGFERDVGLRTGSPGRGSWRRSRRHENGPPGRNRNDRWRGGRCTSCGPHGNDRFDILLADAAARAGASNRRKIDAMLLCQAAHQRRAVNAFARRVRRGRSRNRRSRHWRWRGRPWDRRWCRSGRSRNRSFRRGRRLGFRRSRGCRR